MPGRENILAVALLCLAIAHAAHADSGTHGAGSESGPTPTASPSPTPTSDSASGEAKPDATSVEKQILQAKNQIDDIERRIKELGSNPASGNVEDLMKEFQKVYDQLGELSKQVPEIAEALETMRQKAQDTIALALLPRIGRDAVAEKYGPEVADRAAEAYARSVGDLARALGESVKGPWGALADAVLGKPKDEGGKKSDKDRDVEEDDFIDTSMPPAKPEPERAAVPGKTSGAAAEESLWDRLKRNANELYDSVAQIAENAAKSLSGDKSLTPDPMAPPSPKSADEVLKQAASPSGSHAPSESAETPPAGPPAPSTVAGSPATSPPSSSPSAPSVAGAEAPPPTAPSIPLGPATPRLDTEGTGAPAAGNNGNKTLTSVPSGPSIASSPAKPKTDGGADATDTPGASAPHPGNDSAVALDTPPAPRLEGDPHDKRAPRAGAEPVAPTTPVLASLPPAPPLAPSSPSAAANSPASGLKVFDEGFFAPAAPVGPVAATAAAAPAVTGASPGLPLNAALQMRPENAPPGSIGNGGMYSIQPESGYPSPYAPVAAAPSAPFGGTAFGALEPSPYAPAPPPERVSLADSTPPNVFTVSAEPASESSGAGTLYQQAMNAVNNAISSWTASSISPSAPPDTSANGLRPPGKTDGGTPAVDPDPKTAYTKQVTAALDNVYNGSKLLDILRAAVRPSDRAVASDAKPASDISKVIDMTPSAPADDQLAKKDPKAKDRKKGPGAPKKPGTPSDETDEGNPLTGPANPDVQV